MAGKSPSGRSANLTRKWRRKRLKSLNLDSEIALRRDGAPQPWRSVPEALSTSARGLVSRLKNGIPARQPDNARRLDKVRRPARRCYWNSFRISCAFWLAIDSDWMPSCSCVWSACNWVEAVFMFASTIPEMPSE